MNFVVLIFAVVAGVSLLASVIQGLVAWHSTNPLQRKQLRPYIIFSCLLTVIFVIATYFSSIAHPSTTGEAGDPTAQQTATPTIPLTITPTDTPTPTITPTPTSTLAPTPTELKLAGPETLSVNITLHCDCTDPVVATITKIVVEPAQNRMLWTISFYNNAQSRNSASFNVFHLQKGDQANDPTTREQTYAATGTGIGVDNVGLQAGETKPIILTFSYIPYKGISYTLTSELETDYVTVKYNPVLINF